MSGAEGGLIDGVLTVLGAVIGWAGRARRHRKRQRRQHESLDKRIASNEKAIRRLWRDVGRLESDVTNLALSLWEGNRRGRRWHDPRKP